MEAYQADKAEAAADRLLTLMPAAGHMVHMPAHIYQRVGRYADAAKSNVMAIAADGISQCQAGLYPMAYYPHNLHFLWFASTAEGKSKVAIQAARKAASRVNDETLKAVPLLAGFRVVPYYALTRFGKWDEMLREPEPPATSAYLNGMWHYARGTAFLGKGQTDDAATELAKITETLKESHSISALWPHWSCGDDYCSRVLAGRLMRQEELRSAIAHLEPRCGSKTRWFTPSRLNFITRRVMLWEQFCSRPDVPRKPKRFTGKICGGTRRTAGRSLAWRRP
jgi:hypothetical protein